MQLYFKGSCVFCSYHGNKTGVLIKSIFDLTDHIDHDFFDLQCRDIIELNF